MLDPFYPVVPDAGWVARLVPAGARLAQLRIKEQPDDVRRQVREAKAVCAAHGASYGLISGECAGGPCNNGDALERIAIVIQGGVISVA